LSRPLKVFFKAMNGLIRALKGLIKAPPMAS
jgi:hypothetical protein